MRPGVDYPATLIMTGDHDDRVFPAHSFKFAAAMQHADPHGQPILLRVETRAGHGQGMPTAKLIDEVVEQPTNRELTASNMAEPRGTACVGIFTRLACAPLSLTIIYWFRSPLPRRV